MILYHSVCVCVCVCVSSCATLYHHQVNFNEPLSFLQRLNEDLIYHDVLNGAVKLKASCEQICHVAAFASSSYASTVYRTGKPFNPLLGETFECDRRCEMGWRSLTEQVSVL